MSFAAYTRFELRRTFRNRRFMLFAFGFPLVLYILIAAPNRHEHDLASSGLPAPVYFMVGLLTFGTMNAMLSAGTRIAAERSAGWNRQLRITPLVPQAYFRTKVLTGYATSLVTIGLLYAAGFALGVRLPAGDWAEMTALILVGLIPFAALGILIGHLVGADSIGPALGGSTALLAFLGGVWFPLGHHGVMAAVGQALPSYWLVQAAHVGEGGSSWSFHGWAVVAAWTVGASMLARRAYLRDTKKA
jgi:ABC-2 type transport system permease protein